MILPSGATRETLRLIYALQSPSIRSLQPTLRPLCSSGCTTASGYSASCLPRPKLSPMGIRFHPRSRLHAIPVRMHPSWRLFSVGSAGGGKDDESDDDFKPQRKAVSTNPDEVSQLIQQQIEANKVMLYMKGTPSEPRCGFSAQVVRILHTQGISFSSVNVLDYPPIREGIKTFSEWPTIPQLYVDGEFVGGCDILTQLHQSGELEKLFEEAKLKE